MHIGFDQIVIETSPFMRCIQTACLIAEKLGVKEIKINYLSSEIQTKNHFDECPIKILEFSKLSEEEKSKPN